MKKLIGMLTILILAGCGINFYQPFVSDDSDEWQMIEAQKELDQGNYSKATELLGKLTTDTNTKRILEASASLGTAGLDLWSIVRNILNGDSGSSSSSGVDNIFDLIGESVLGTGDTRTERVTVLKANIALLQAAPDPDQSNVQNLSCFLAGILALPMVTDSTSALTTAQTALTSIASTSTGSGSSAEECPDLDELNSSLQTLKEVREAFTTILETAEKCKILNFDDEASSLNTIEQQMQKLTTNADKGCDTVDTSTCGNFCDALNLGCVQSSITADETATAGDDVIATCELVQNCINPTTCFN